MKKFKKLKKIEKNLHFLSKFKKNYFKIGSGSR